MLLRQHAIAALRMALAVTVVSWMSAMAIAQAQRPADETDPASLADYPKCDKAQRGRALDLGGAYVTFEDEFDKPSVTPPSGAGPWYAPVHGGFGKAKFLPPRPDRGPFFFNDGKLTIRMERQNNRWSSGIMQTVNAKGEGFIQRYGYFEARASFPKGPGTWPVFFVKTVNQYTDVTRTRVEFDIIEAYGGRDWRGHHASFHLWPRRNRVEGQLTKHWWKSCYSRLSEDMFDGSFHLYGAEFTPDWVIIYFDRKELARFPALPEVRHPLYVLVALGLNAKEARETDESADLVLDYVRVWQRQDWADK